MTQETETLEKSLRRSIPKIPFVVVPETLYGSKALRVPRSAWHLSDARPYAAEGVLNEVDVMHPADDLVALVVALVVGLVVGQNLPRTAPTFTTDFHIVASAHSQCWRGSNRWDAGSP